MSSFLGSMSLSLSPILLILWHTVVHQWFFARKLQHKNLQCQFMKIYLSQQIAIDTKSKYTSAYSSKEELDREREPLTLFRPPGELHLVCICIYI